MNQDIEAKHTYEIEYVVLSGDYRERRMVAKEIKPGHHQGFEYQAKFILLNWRVKYLELFCYLFLIW